jgi:hypothetical protein
MGRKCQTPEGLSYGCGLRGWHCRPGGLGCGDRVRSFATHRMTDRGRGCGGGVGCLWRVRCSRRWGGCWLEWGWLVLGLARGSELRRVGWPGRFVDFHRSPHMVPTRSGSLMGTSSDRPVPVERIRRSCEAGERAAMRPVVGEVTSGEWRVTSLKKKRIPHP